MAKSCDPTLHDATRFLDIPLNEAKKGERPDEKERAWERI
jgi:hypothetical protein